MGGVVYDRAAQLVLLQQLSERAAGSAVPIRWHEFYDALSADVVGKHGASRDSWTRVLIGDGLLFSWQLSWETILLSLIGRRVVYLCWGLPSRSAWKDAIAAMVLRRAHAVLVNDTKTRSEIEARCGRRAVVVPYYGADMEFYAFKALAGRGDFIFCNGSNDRDPQLLLGMAEHGFRIVWLVNDTALRASYEGRHGNLILRSRVSYEELRELYQTCMAMIMPMSRDVHCAGQTTGMEALSCGAPLFISAGRTATTFAEFPSVISVDGSSPDDWISVITTALADAEISKRTELSRERLAARVSRVSQFDALAPAFGWGLGGASVCAVEPGGVR